MMTKEGSTKIVNIMTLEAGVLVLGCGHIIHKMKKNIISFEIFFSSQGQR